MKKLIPLFVVLLITSCNQLYRSIPKAPRSKNLKSEIPVSADLRESKQNLTEKKIFTLAENDTTEKQERLNIIPNESSVVHEEQAIQSVQEKVDDFDKTKDTLYIDEDQLNMGERAVKVQTAMNIGTSLMFIFFYFSLIFIGFGIYNIIRYNNLPYVTLEVDRKMQRKIRNFYIAIGVDLFLLLLIIILFILL